MQKSYCLYVGNQLGMFYGLFLCYIASQFSLNMHSYF